MQMSSFGFTVNLQNKHKSEQLNNLKKMYAKFKVSKHLMYIRNSFNMVYK